MRALDEAPGGAGGCAPSADVLGAEDRLEILKLQALWAAVVRAGRPERAAEFCADDVVVLPPNAPPISGREAARAWLSGLDGGPVERIEVERVDLRGGPKSAWLTATVTTTRRRPDGRRAKERERRLWAFTKSGGAWRVRLAGWEAEEPPAVEPDEPTPAAVAQLNGAGTQKRWRPLFHRPP